MNDVRKIAESLKKMRQLSEWSADEIVKNAESVANKLTQSRQQLDTQIRKFLDAMRQIERKFSKEKVVLLKPKLAYAVSRNPDLLPLFEVLEPAIDRVSNENEFKKLVSFMEAIVAYYKFPFSKRR
jgi:CRISPR type III-A-associated protein Csm2